ncbi:flavodoxin [Streptococcus caviae]|uniref:flavodoxin n=1 Tax=Streptococcus sp. 'caviae' TaxID=1915004 RepID=UPI00094B9AE8|nr:flavodoxin [Streptococcus sp. 'caviae']OLN84300.1 flavodoxin [Streptococcus sp. 'caviae']
MIKTLILYFSNTGTTKRVAELMAQELGADLYRILAEQDYTAADLTWTNANCRANQEQNDEASRPAYSGSLPDLTSYDQVIIGHPIWWRIPPKIIRTVLEDLDLTGKKVASFATSGGSDYHEAQRAMEQWTGLRLPKGQILSSSASVKKWLSTI